MTFLTKKTAASIPVTPLDAESLKAWLKKQDKATQAWVVASGFTAAPGTLLTIPAKNGGIARVLFGAREGNLYAFADLPARLPAHKAGYFLDIRLDKEKATQAATGWALGSYAFSRYKAANKKNFAALVLPEKADRKAAEETARAVFLVRDLVNTPANDMGPDDLAKAAQKVAKEFKAKVTLIRDKDLLKKNYPMIHAVGQGSPRRPLLIDLRWGSAENPRVTLVGKGVCFDTGGLDIKPGSAMALMKKDMGGAAHALGLAQMIMAHKLPVSLRVLIPAVENSTDGNSFRPGDIWPTRKGLTVEIGDTDAEGRLVLSDALTEASSEKPKLIIDFATLTGAARVALGPELPATFCNDERTASQLLAAAGETEDPLWRLPLWKPYADMLGSKVADSNNIGGSYAGAITAALFLEKFVDKATPWVHIDTFAWNPGAKPGRPEGGEALGIRACFAMIERMFA